LIVVSVDGLDWRYLRNRDSLGLAIPNLRYLFDHGAVAQGVVGVFPTVTWPSHTTIITGVRPDQHGILGNRRPASEGGDYYWYSSMIRVPTLWQCVAAVGRETAAITWPVTAKAPITYDLPEYFERRNGGAMDFTSVASQSTPGIVDAISTDYPSFPQQWMDDRTRTLAALYILRQKRPDLVLLHLVDLDGAEHDQGPFVSGSIATLERTDELIGLILGALAPDYDLVLTSDHGFERVDHIANLPVLLAGAGIPGTISSIEGGVAVTRDQRVADFLRGKSASHEDDIGREIPRAELQQYAPQLMDYAAVFEPTAHVLFGDATSGPYLTVPTEKGNHGFWPTLPDYRSVFILWGKDVQAIRLPELQMTEIEGRLAAVLGLACNR
jgi:predicted AlkP superfamily pyrophosphatase or phosphodiesterase